MSDLNVNSNSSTPSIPKGSKIKETDDEDRDFEKALLDQLDEDENGEGVEGANQGEGLSAPVEFDQSNEPSIEEQNNSIAAHPTQSPFITAPPPQFKPSLDTASIKQDSELVTRVDGTWRKPELI